MDYRTFFFYNLSGGIVWATVFGFLGFYIGNNLPLLGKIISNINFIFIAAVVIIATLLLVRHFRAKGRAKENVAAIVLQTSQDRPHANLTLPTYKTDAPAMNPSSQAAQPVQD